MHTAGKHRVYDKYEPCLRQVCTVPTASIHRPCNRYAPCLRQRYAVLAI